MDELDTDDLGLTSVASAIPVGAKQLVILRVVAFGGNASEDPVVNGVTVEIT